MPDMAQGHALSSQIDHAFGTGQALAVLSVDLQGGASAGTSAGAPAAAPSDLHLLPAGQFRAVDGRPDDCEAWLLDAAIAGRVVALAASRQTDIVIDYEHQTLLSQINGQPAPAAGWIPRTLEWREGSGLWATGITWVGDAEALIAQRKYRYQSSVFVYEKKTGEVLEIISVALTNVPGLDGLRALAPLARLQSVFLNRREPNMAANDETGNDALAREVASLKTQVSALTQERDTAAAALSTLRGEIEQQRISAEKAQHSSLVKAALEDGRLEPALKGWAEKQPLAALKEFLDKKEPLAVLGRQSQRCPGGGANGLSDADLAMCRTLGVTPEAFAAQREAAKEAR